MSKPLTPPDCDLRDFEFMPLDVNRLRRSKAWLVAKRKPALAFYMINLWTAAWHEVPAASLENDDDVLADLAMCDPSKWPALREEVLRGWVLCDDGRLSNPALAKRAINALDAKKRLSARIKRVYELASDEWAALRSAVFARDNYTCIYCGASGKRLECDHLHPYSLGGLSVMANLGTACKTCNRKKGAKTAREFRNERR